MIVGAFDRGDDAHGECARLLAGTRERRVIPSPVLVEADRFLTRHLGPEAFTTMLDQVDRRALDVEDLAPPDYRRVAELLRTYADLRVGSVDCAVLAIAERLGEPKLATLDHRHFAAMRPAHMHALTLLP